MPTVAADTRSQVLTPAELPFEQLCARFAEAAAGDPNELNLLIAGHPVRIRIAGRRWSDIVRAAMGHLEVAGKATTPELCIDAWDAEETGVPIVTAAQSNLPAPPVLMRTSQDGHQVGEERPHSLVWLDRTARRIVGCIESTRFLNLDERARPFHKLISAWLEENGIQFVHSGLIEHNGSGVLFVGNGGAGKSTSSIACLRAGMGYLGDDFLGLGVAAGRFVGHGLYASCLLNVHHIQRFPDLRPLGHAPNHAIEDKCVLYLKEAFPHSLKRRAPVDALVLPRVVDREMTSFRPATKMAALKAIAPTSVMYLPRPNRAAFERLTQLVEKTPCFWLELGRNIESIPLAVAALVDSIRIPEAA
jgi:hypothetical protein